MRLHWFLLSLLSCVLLAASQHGDTVFDDPDFGGFDLSEDLDDDMQFDEDSFPLDFDPDNIPGEEAPEIVLVTKPYSPPTTDGLMMVETFDSPLAESWVISSDEQYPGTWLHRERKREVMPGDRGLEIEHEARRVAISRRIPTISPDDGDLVIHYEVNTQDGLTCGGAYMKLFNSEEKPLQQFTNETPYTIMFGPDKCGSTNKVHVIFRTKNPVTGEWSEHHLKNSPSVPTFGDFTHRYTLVVRTDDTIEVYVDDKAVHTASLHSDFQPAFTPSEEIEDPSDSKPEDWVEEKEIPDPASVKPEDWDDDAPARIPDPEDTVPEGWLVDEPLQVDDPSASAPDDWDVESQGQWIASQIPNSKCTVGCGPYTPKTIPNPAYQGKWEAPKVPNPDYIGPWSPRRIANPAFFKNEKPHILGSPIDALGFELWTMNGGIHFDNIVVARSLEAVEKFVESTWAIRHSLEEQSANSKKASKSNDKAKSTGESLLRDFRVVAGVSVAVAVFTLITWRFCIKPGMKPSPAEVKKEHADAKKDDSEGDTAGGEQATVDDTADGKEATTVNDTAGGNDGKVEDAKGGVRQRKR